MTAADERGATETARPSVTAAPPNAAVLAENVKLYLDYLEKEMTIMGVLSAVAALSLALNQVLGAEKATAFHEMREYGLPYLLLGSLFLLGAAWFFYRQRSRLAWFYGQIALAVAAPAIPERPLFEWLREADSWTTWLPYHWGFCFLLIGILGFSFSAATMSELARTRAVLPLYLAVSTVGIANTWRYTRLLSLKPYEDEPSMAAFFGLRTGGEG